MKENTTEIEASTKSIIHNLEFKLSKLNEPDNNLDGNDEKNLSIQKFCSEAF